jgi:hypothetical protein
MLITIIIIIKLYKSLKAMRLIIIYIIETLLLPLLIYIILTFAKPASNIAIAHLGVELRLNYIRFI